jgi:hypothetical protein
MQCRGLPGSVLPAGNVSKHPPNQNVLSKCVISSRMQTHIYPLAWIPLSAQSEQLCLVVRSNGSLE